MKVSNPLIWAVANIGFAGMVLVRRKAITGNQDVKPIGKYAV